MTQPNDLSQVVTDEGVCLCGCTENCVVVAELRQRIRSQDAVIKRMVSEESTPTPAETRGGRFDCSELGYMRETPDGAFVRHSDYATLARQLAEAKEDIDGVRDALDFDRIRVTATQAAIAARATREFMCEEMTRFRVRAEQAEAQLAQATARLEAVEGLPAKWRVWADRSDVPVANWHLAANELDAALQPKESTND